MKNKILATLLVLILQPYPTLAQSSHLLSVTDYFPIQTGNAWVSQPPLFIGHGNLTFFGQYIMEQFKSDSTAFIYAGGLAIAHQPDRPCSGCGTVWMTIKIDLPSIILKGPYTEYDSTLLYRPFEKTGIMIDLTDTTNIISTDSTIICPIGTFEHCVVFKTWGAFAPGFGPIGPYYVYAKVNGVEYGIMPVLSVDSKSSNRPNENSLYHAYPNPFNQSTAISFYLCTPGQARITIFNAQGQTVRTLLDEYAATGLHHLAWDGMTDDRLPCPSGVYFISLQSAEFSQKQTLTLVR